MDKIELIRAEIERHIKHYEKLERNDFQNGELYICQELLFFIDSLSEESISEDLEKEIETSIRLLNGLHTFEDNKSWYRGKYEELKEFARHFYELGKK